MAQKAHYDYFSHEADTGIIGYGTTVEEAFVQAARAVFALMADIDTIKPQQKVDMTFEESDLEFALVTWINQLLPEARAQGIIFGQFDLERKNDHWYGQAWGEAWQDNTERGTEVKGATLTELKVFQQKNGTWVARCVVDV